MTVEPGCNIATVRKCTVMMKHGPPRDREFIDAVVERGGELVRPIDLVRMMRSGEEWASEDHGVIFYRLVRVLNGASAIAPDETEFGGREDVARDIQVAMTHASELGFVVLHEGSAYTDVMDEIPIPISTAFGATFGRSKSSVRNMVKSIDPSNQSKESKSEGADKANKKKRVCLPVFVSRDTRFLGLHVGTIEKTDTPVQVKGLQLTERLVCKHVKLYHPAGWPRSKQEECLDQTKPSGGGKDDEAAQIEKLKAEAKRLEDEEKKMRDAVAEWKEASDKFIMKAKDVLGSWSTIVDGINKEIGGLTDDVFTKWHKIDHSKIESETQLRINATARRQSEFKDKIKQMNTQELESTATTNALRKAIKIFNDGTVNYNIHGEGECVGASKKVVEAIAPHAKAADSALKNLADLQKECAELGTLYVQKIQNASVKQTQAVVTRVVTSMFTNTPNNIETEIGTKMIHMSKTYTQASPKSGKAPDPIESYKTARDAISEQFNKIILEVNTQAKTALDKADKKQREDEKNKKKSEEQEQGQGPLSVLIEAAQIDVPQWSDMRVAVQVSGELFRVLHFTRSEKDERKSQKKEEKTKKEEAKEAEEEVYEEKEAIDAYAELGATKTNEENVAGYNRSNELQADAEDYKECVSAARKYLEECGIVNDITDSWTNVGWRLARPERPERPDFGSNARHERPERPERPKGPGRHERTDMPERTDRPGRHERTKRPERPKKQGSEFGELEDVGKLELVLVPLSAFPDQKDDAAKSTKYDRTAEIRSDAVWIIDVGAGKKDCPTCAVCGKKSTEDPHKTKTAKEGLFVRYSKAQEDVIKGLAIRFCFHPIRSKRCSQVHRVRWNGLETP